MDSDNILTFALIGVGGYAVYKIFSNSGVGKTTDAIGSVAETTADAYKDIITGTTGIFKNPEQTAYNAAMIPSNLATSYGKGQLSLATGIGKAIIDTSSKIFGTKSTDQLIIAQNAANMTPIMTNIGISSQGGLYSSAKPLVANTTTKYGAAAQSAGGKGLFSSATVRVTTKPKYSKPY